MKTFLPVLLKGALSLHHTFNGNIRVYTSLLLCTLIMKRCNVRYSQTDEETKSSEQNEKAIAKAVMAAAVGSNVGMDVDTDGNGTLSLLIEGWTIGAADSTNVLEKSVIIYEKADDFTSQPSVNAGSSISCGLIKQN